MGSNVQKIDLDELRKTREALNAERGITTPEPAPKPKKKAEDFSAETPAESTSSPQASPEQTDEPAEVTNAGDNSAATQPQDEKKPKKEKDLSVYDSFAPFEINTEAEVPSVAAPVEEEPEEEEESIDDIIGALGEIFGDMAGGNAFDDDDDPFGDDDETDDEEEPEASENDNDEEDDQKVVGGADLESKISSFEEAKSQNEADESDDENIYQNLKNVSESNELNDYISARDIEKSQTDSNDGGVEVGENETPEPVAADRAESSNDSGEQTKDSDEPPRIILPPRPRNDENKDGGESQTAASEEPINYDDMDFDSFDTSQMYDIDGIHNEKPGSTDAKKQRAAIFAVPDEEKEEEPEAENQTQPEKKSGEPEESQAEPEGGEAQSDEAKEPEKENPDLLKKIPDANFIDIIRSKSFMSSDNFTCIYGTDEQSNVFCQNFKDFYNTIIFDQEDTNVFRLFSSLILSLLLKNSNYDIKFAILDAKSGGQFSVYNNLSYMFFNRVAESNREIISCLSEIHSEIDSRYESLAKARVKNIENFNDKMKKAKIAPLPYLVVFFNDYTRASHLDVSGEIDSQLSYILRFGRLVGVYVNIVAFDENIAENINFNLQTRIAFKTDVPESSASEIGEEGAEKLAADDEFLVKTLYSDKLFHIKPPKITKKEIELLIKNIEK